MWAGSAVAVMCGSGRAEFSDSGVNRRICLEGLTGPVEQLVSPAVSASGRGALSVSGKHSPHFCFFCSVN